MENRDGIVLEGYEGTWYVIDEAYIGGQELYLLESEQEGDELPGIIVDEDLHVIMDDAWNGFDDLDEDSME